MVVGTLMSIGEDANVRGDVEGRGRGRVGIWSYSIPLFVTDNVIRVIIVR